MVTVLGVQIITMFVLFTATFLCGNIPLLIASRSSNVNHGSLRSSGRSRTEIEEIGSDGDEEAVTEPHPSPTTSISATFTEKTVSFLLFFGGGVLFTTCFLHLLPEVREAFETKNKNGEDNQQNDRKYPVAELITCGGFFVVYFVEEIAHRFFHKKPHSNQLQRKPNAVPVSHLHQNSGKDGHDEDDSSRCILADSDAQTLNYGSLDAVVVSNREQRVARLHDSQEESMFNSIIIVIALSFHSIFEGMAIGLQDSVSHVWQLALAIGIHKLVISFTVGVELLKDTKSVKKIIVHLLIFSFMSPLGIALAATARLKVDILTSGILSAVATGSLLYITFLHILAKEKLSSPLPGLIQYLGVLCGFGAMAVLQYLTEPFDKD